jgi:Zn-finger nucleic acid-binding protein
MRIADREGIEIDYCPQCRGVWLDRGELEKIIAQVEGQDSRGRERDNDDDDDEHEHHDYDDRDSGHRRDRESQRDDRYERDRRYGGTEQARRGGHRREGFLSNLFEMFGGD